MDSKEPDVQESPRIVEPMNERLENRRSGSIRYRLLFLLLGIAALISLVITLIAVDTTRRQGAQASQISIEALQAQAETYLLQITASNANENDLTLELLRNSAIHLADYTESVFGNPEAYSSSEFWQFSDHMFLGENGQYLNGEADLTSVFVPYFQPIDEQVTRDIELGGYLEPQMQSLFESNKSITAVYFASEHEVTRYYPNIRLGLLVPNDFTVTQRVWYTSVIPDNNPEGRALWSTVYVDATGQGLVTTASAPVFAQGGSLIGVVGFDVTLVDMSANVEAARILESGYTFLMDQSGQSVALSEQGFQDILGRPSEPDEASALLNETTTPFAPIIAEMLGGNSGFQKIDLAGEVLYVAYAPLKNTGWSLGTVARENEILAAVTELSSELDRTSRELVTNRILPAAAVLFVIAAVIGWILTTRLVNPIRKLSQAAEQVAEGRWDVDIPQAGRDEIGSLGRAFSSMTRQLRRTLDGLEQRVMERTRDVEQGLSYLRAAAEVGRAASSILDTNKLMRQVVDVIRERFDLYYVGLFLLDATNQYAVLQAGTGEPGRIMLDRKHRIRVGEGMVGWSVENKRPRVAADADEDAVRLASELLPLTRSEAALPLVSRGMVIGALTVQSERPGIFTEDTLSVLQTMADQVALALDNARLFTESEEALKTLRRSYGELSQEAWLDLLQTRRTRGYRWDGQSIHPVSDADGSQETGDDTTLVKVPIRMRDQTLGVIEARKPEAGGAWTQDELNLMNTLVDQLSVALENARLYEDTQSRAERERVLADITSKVRATTDVNTILQTAVQELAEALRVPRGAIRLRASDGQRKNDGGSENGQ